METIHQLGKQHFFVHTIKQHTTLKPASKVKLGYKHKTVVPCSFSINA